MLTLRDKIAQMLIIGFREANYTAQSDLHLCVQQNGIGGVVLFDTHYKDELKSRNIQNETQLKSLTSTIYEKTVDVIGVPPLISIDCEGGVVNRLRALSSVQAYPSAKKIRKLEYGQYKSTVANMAQTLGSLGFNFNFAPVVDLDFGPSRGIIGKLERSFDSDPAVVAMYAEDFCKISSDYNIGTCLKHFPGHGSAFCDSHQKEVDVTKSFKTSELEPYKTLIQTLEKFPVAVMTAHIINRCLDENGLPATVSPIILQQLLRKEFQFSKIIISDDLQMRAISNAYSMDAAMTAAINAGCDMLIIGNQIDYTSPISLVDMVDTAVKSGKISEAKIEDAFLRIQQFKTFLS